MGSLDCLRESDVLLSTTSLAETQNWVIPEMCELDHQKSCRGDRMWCLWVFWKLWQLEVFWHISFVKTTVVQVSKSMIFCRNVFCSKLVLGKSYFYDIMIIRTEHVAHVISKWSKLIGTSYVYTYSPDSLSNIMVLILWVNRIWYFIFANYSTMKEMKARGISLLSKYK